MEVEGEKVKFSDLRKGTRLIVSTNELSCLRQGEIREVGEVVPGDYFVDCRVGRHYLQMSLDLEGYVLGFRSAES